MATGIDYNDERFAEVEADKKQALAENEKVYSGMIEQSGQFFQAQVDATKQWEQTQKQLQQEQTDFALEQIEQQKEQAQKDYTKEQKGAYADWQKQSNQYGAEAEQMAANGLTNTGFSESSKVSMYNMYQNRTVAAREGFNQIMLNYDNAMKEAILQNNSALAEIALTSLQQQLQYLLDGFQYENTLLLEQANKKLEIDNMYYGRYQDVVNQINEENALAESKRQFDLANNTASITDTVSGSDVNSNQTAITKNGYTEHGNSYETSLKSDYYFKGTKQPRYINNQKAFETPKKLQEVFGKNYSNVLGSGFKATQKIWFVGGSFYIWHSASKQYVDITDEYMKALK